MSLKLESLPKPRFRYSPALRMGPFVKTAGMVGLPVDGGGLVPGGVVAELTQILSNLKAFMADNGLTNAELMSATIYTTVFHRFAEVERAWCEFFADEDQVPTRTSVGVSRLPLNAEVEAEFLFFQPGDRA